MITKIIVEKDRSGKWFYYGKLGNGTIAFQSRHIYRRSRIIKAAWSLHSQFNKQVQPGFEIKDA